MGRSRRVIITSSARETFLVGRLLGRLLRQDSVVFLYGDLGAGKTLLTKGMVSSFCKIHEKEVSSPTYAYLHVYGDDPFCFYHFDLYRLAEEAHFFELGFGDLCEQNVPVVIEWPEKLDKSLFKSVLEIHLQYKEETTRSVTFSGTLDFDWTEFLKHFEVMRQDKK